MRRMESAGLNRRGFLAGWSGIRWIGWARRPACVGLGCLLLLVGCGAATEKTNRPGVLFIVVDDLNDWTTLFHPDHPIQTPNLERLARRGMFFRQAYSVAPACNPSRAAVMTGIGPHTSGVYDNHHEWARLLPEAVTLPRYFMKHGYETYGAGKIFHHGPAGEELPGKSSFQSFLPMKAPRPPASGRNHNGYTKGPLANIVYDWGEHDQKIVDIDTVEWCERILGMPRRKPRFVAAGIFKPHMPFYADRKTFERYPFQDTVMPPMPEHDLDDVSPVAVGMAHREFFLYQNTVVGPEDRAGSLKKMVQSYQASADFADQMVGRLLDRLDTTGQAGNTIIVLWSDHGYHLGDKESCTKFTLWEKANHVPLIIVAPGVTKPGSVCSKPVSLLDVYPTLVELAGLPPAAVEGVSLVPLLKEPAQNWDPALMTMGRGNHAVRSDRWRYIRYRDGSEELYDHLRDPWEWNNLASNPEYLDVIANHRKWIPAVADGEVRPTQ